MPLNFLIAITLICWSLWGICDKKALAKSDPVNTLLMTYAFFLPAAALGALAMSAALPGWHLTARVLLWTGLACLVNWLGVIAYLKAMSKAEASYVLGITSGYPLIMQVIAVFALGEHIVPLRVVGSLLIFLGVFTIGFDQNKTKGGDKLHDHMGLPDSLPDLRKERTVLAILMVVAMLGWGSMGIFDKMAVQSATALEAYMGVLIWNAVLALISWIVAGSRGLVSINFKRALWLFPALSALCLMVGGVAYIAALSVSTATYVIVITGCYPLLMYGFAVWLLGEKLNATRLAGIAIIVAGGIFTQMTQSLS